MFSSARITDTPPRRTYHCTVPQYALLQTASHGCSASNLASCRRSCFVFRKSRVYNSTRSPGIPKFHTMSFSLSRDILRHCLRSGHAFSSLTHKHTHTHTHTHTHSHSQHVILITTPVQQELHERASIFTLYVHFLSCLF